MDSGADRTATNDLAEGAEWAQVLGSVKVGPAVVLNLADPGNFRMVVKDFGGE
ncbi:MAG: hypothetical protein ACLQVL_06455 [Terriglobia bacterium]